MRKDSITDLELDDRVHDVLIIGAGPCGLAVASRLREKHPSALFTDVEQARYSWVNRNRHRTCVRDKKSGHVSAPRPVADHPSLLVLDGSSDQWMGRWNALFKRLDIPHLRSPMFFHPDPSDRDALLAYVHEHGGLGGAAQEITGCVGRELSKHHKKRRNKKPHATMPASIEINERDRRDYFAPTTESFAAFCKCCIERYGLDKDIIRHETVTALAYDHINELDDKIFTVSTPNRQYRARTVVLAAGAGKPNIPKPFSPQDLAHGASHAMQLQQDGLLSPALAARVAARRDTRVLVIGGGLMSAQVAVRALQAGVTHVHLAMRGPLKIKAFDVDLAWLSKFQNHQRAVFWSADCVRERMRIIAQARGGGSITPRYARRLRELEAGGRLTVHTHTGVEDKEYDAERGRWKVRIRTRDETAAMEFHHVYFATGAGGSIRDMDCLEAFQAAHPVQDVEGIPVLTDDLQWSPDVPLFVTGRYASLQLGPGAGNLEGARLGAERIAWRIDELLGGQGDQRDQSGDYVRGITNMFQCLDAE